MSPPLTDDEVNLEMRKMVAFIQQEAIEKAREIQVKADEEFNIEKAKLVRQEALAIEANFARKLKKADIERKIAQSTHINNSRIRVLQTREQQLEQLFDEARQRLLSSLDSLESYPGLLQKLALQCFYTLMDDSVHFQVRQRDLSIAQTAVAAAATEYEGLVGRAARYTILQGAFLSDASAGGLIAFGLGGKISCDNTLEKRFELLTGLMLPDIRVMILGISENRKFFD